MANRSSRPAPERPPSQPQPRGGAKPAGAGDGGFVERKYDESTYPQAGLGNGGDPKAAQEDDRKNDEVRRAATRKGVK